MMLSGILVGLNLVHILKSKGTIRQHAKIYTVKGKKESAIGGDIVSGHSKN